VFKALHRVLFVDCIDQF